MARAWVVRETAAGEQPGGEQGPDSGGLRRQSKGLDFIP